MKSLRSLFRIGLGPSSSHTMGPNRAAKLFAERCPNPDSYRVTLYGSLAATGEGHMTDKAIIKVLEPLAKLELIWQPKTFLPFHPNGMLFEGIKNGKVIDNWTIYSIGGGELANESTTKNEEDIYPLTTIHEVMDWCDETGCTFWEYVEKYEGPEIWDFLSEVWETMKSTIKRGLENEGVLPGGLGLQRKANTYLNKSFSYSAAVSSKAKVYAYALATSEENASGSTIVTTPTCGSSGVLPAVLYHLSTS
ncbi:MAG: L-serine ammonia-lyase, iron-sulfur-dependent, subunit alpha, partial [Bacteroidaceae bacterium]|nr:L-serine ammonia-lyase, iron-sulfur-dependent, subunit alpha [Bacteroidaceae bacterium]